MPSGMVMSRVSVLPPCRMDRMSLLLAPAPVRNAMIAAMARRPHFNFELHAIDLADAIVDELPTALIARQPDLRVPLAKKTARLDEIVARMVDTFEVVTLADAATRLA